MEVLQTLVLSKKLDLSKQAWMFVLFHDMSWKLLGIAYFLGGTSVSPGITSPPVRWGLLDFMSAGLLLLLFVLLLLRQTSTASSWSQWSLPCPNSKPNRAFPAGHPQQARDASGPCRTRTASPRSECSMPDLNCKREIAGSLPDPNSRPRMRGVLAGPQLHSRDRSGPCRTWTASPGSEWSPPDSLERMPEENVRENAR